MSRIALELPEELVKAAHFDPNNLSQEAAKLIALELFREQKISLGRAAELCSTPLAAFMDFAAVHGVPPISYDTADLEFDLATINRLRS